MTTVYLSLGSNIGDREDHLRNALEQLTAGGVRVLRVSPIYETEPMEVTGQSWFLNMVVEAGTDLSPAQLLEQAMRIERALGRVRTLPKGPRTIDIDILLYGSQRVKTAALEIPHPRMAQRRFVLAPLADLAPDLRHPVTGRSVREMLHDVTRQAARRLPPD